MRPTELLRSSTFRLAALYMVLFAVSVLLLLGFIYWSTVAFMSEQVDTTIDTEIVGLSEQYRERGLNGLVRTINDRIERNPDSPSIYLFASPTFNPLAGNLSAWPEETPTEDGWLNFGLERSTSTIELRARARVFVLQGNFKLLVGRDVRELTDTQELIVRALRPDGEQDQQRDVSAGSSDVLEELQRRPSRPLKVLDLQQRHLSARGVLG